MMMMVNDADNDNEFILNLHLKHERELDPYHFQKVNNTSVCVKQCNSLVSMIANFMYQLD